MVPEYPPDTIGGGGVVYAALAQGLSAKHEVAVFSAWDDRRSWVETPSMSRVDGIEIHRYPLPPVLRSLPNLRSVLPPNPRGIARLRADLRRWAPDVGHLHGYGYAFVDVGAAFLRRSNTPYLFTFHGVPTTQRSAPVPVRVAYGAYEAWGLTRTIEGAAGTSAVAPDAAGHWRVDQVIPNGIAAASATTLAPPGASSAAALKRRLSIPDGVPLIVGVGRLAHTKGFDVLIKAAELLHTTGVVTVIVGADGGAEVALRALAARLSAPVAFTGRLAPDEVTTLLAAAAVAVVPSRNEPFGLVPLEALRARTRVVATFVGGLRLTVRPPFGELVPTDDPASLAAAIDRALAAGPLEPLALVAAQAMLEEFSWPTVVREYESALTRAADRKMDHV